MSEKTVFCEECRNDVFYTINEKQMIGNIKGDSYSYHGLEAHCVDCGCEIYVAEVNDSNLKALYDVYREKNGIVSQEMILEIPKKYAIGKRPLSILLGWGEQTFSRYFEGDMPTKQYSEILRKIYEDPNYYAEVLEKNKGNLKTIATYEKSRHRVDALLGNAKAEKTIIDLIIEYLVNQCEDITPLALQKALYYIQGFYYAFYKTFLFSEDCEAWVHGPVYRNIYYRYRDYCFDPIKENNIIDDSCFSPSEKAVLDSVVKNICCYSGKVLEKFTHFESPWLSARGDLLENAGCERVIEKEQISNYFSAVKEKYHMMDPKDIKEYTQAMFEKL